MSRIVISDASCLIALEWIDQLDLLRSVFNEVYTTLKVQFEFGSNLPEWIIVRDAIDHSKVEELEQIVDKGEASAISLALEFPESILIIDERKGRNLAIQLKVNIIGTLGVILLARRNGIIPEVKPLILKLEKNGFRFSKEIVSTILKIAGEQ